MVELAKAGSTGTTPATGPIGSASATVGSAGVVLAGVSATGVSTTGVDDRCLDDRCLGDRCRGDRCLDDGELRAGHVLGGLVAGREVVGRYVELPTGQDQVRVVEAAAAAHVVAGVLRPDLGPLRPRAVLVLGDAPQRVARRDDVRLVLAEVGWRGDGGRGGRFKGRWGQSQHPTGLDVCGVRESLPVRHGRVEIEIEDLVGDVQRALLVVIGEGGRDREHRVATSHRVGRDRRRRSSRRWGDIVRDRVPPAGGLVEGAAVVDHERGPGGGGRRTSNRGLGEAGLDRGHRHDHEQPDGDEPSDPLGPAESPHRWHGHAAMAHLVDDLDNGVDHDHGDGDPHDAQAGSQQEVDDGVVAQRIAERVADRARVRRLHPAQRIGRPEPRRRHPSEQVRHPDRDRQEGNRRQREAAGGSVVALVHGPLPSARLHTPTWAADHARRKPDAGITVHAPSGRFRGR